MSAIANFEAIHQEIHYMSMCVVKRRGLRDEKRIVKDEVIVMRGISVNGHNYKKENRHYV